MFEDRRALPENAFGAFEDARHLGAVVGVGQEDDVRIAEPRTTVDPLEDGAQQREVRFEDDDESGAAHLTGELRDVVADAEADHRDRGVFDDVHPRGEAGPLRRAGRGGWRAARRRGRRRAHRRRCRGTRSARGGVARRRAANGAWRSPSAARLASRYVVRVESGMRGGVGTGALSTQSGGGVNCLQECGGGGRRSAAARRRVFTPSTSPLAESAMSHLPDSSFITRFLFENPWPIAILLGLAAVVIGGTGLRDGVLSRVRLAGVLLVLGVAAVFVDRWVVTSGEHAEATVRELVDAMAAVDMVRVDALLASDCAVHRLSPTNPGQSIAPALREYERYVGRTAIEKCSITSLKRASVRDDVGEVQFAVSVTTSQFGSFSAWHARVRRENGVWQVTDLTWLKLNGQDPPAVGMR